MEEQDAAVAQALERAAGQKAQAHLDQMRQALERCFDAIGSSERYRNMYFQPLNEIYALAHYFILAGREPEQIVKHAELADAEGFMHKHQQEMCIRDRSWSGSCGARRMAARWKAPRRAWPSTSAALATTWSPPL